MFNETHLRKRRGIFRSFIECDEICKKLFKNENGVAIIVFENPSLKETHLILCDFVTTYLCTLLIIVSNVCNGFIFVIKTILLTAHGRTRFGRYHVLLLAKLILSNWFKTLFLSKKYIRRYSFKNTFVADFSYSINMHNL